MALNIEVKAHVPDLSALDRRAAAIATGGPTLIAQDDTFFHCAFGRLKLREFSDGTGQLIFYQRPDQSGPKLSSYVLSPTSSPATLREALTLSNGVAGRVKQRTLYMIGRTRLHLDRVRDLGDFMEPEVVMAEGEPPQVGIDEAEDLMKRLGICRDALVDRAYHDLMRERFR